MVVIVNTPIFWIIHSLNHKIIIIHNFIGNNKTGIVMCYSQEHQTNHCSIHWFKHSFLIDFLHYFAKHAIMFFFAMSSIKVDDIVVPYNGPYINHHFS